MGDERTNEVFFDDVFVPDDYVVGEVNKGFQYISRGARPRALHDVHVLPDQAAPRPAVRVRRAPRRVDGEPLRDDPVVRQRIAQLVTEAEVARVLGLRVVAASKSMKGGAPPPTVESSEYKLFATESRSGWRTRRWTSAGPASQLRVQTEDAPMEGRAESTYRYTVIDTIGGGASEIQKNIIARRELGLPKNF